MDAVRRARLGGRQRHVLIPIVTASPWAESVLHVLAHVNVGAVPASCHCPAWMREAEERFGPAAERLLDEDARALARTATTHDALAKLHAVIALFETTEEVARASGRDLAELAAEEVRSPGALRAALEAGPPAEILRAAAELELPLVASLPPFTANREVERALGEVARAAPGLAHRVVAAARPLGLRGRMIDGTILVGAPGTSGATAEHVAWQAAHEATVAEIIARGEQTTYAEVERSALGLLRSRARRAGLEAAHARWLAHLDLSALGPIPDVPDGS